MNNPSSRRQVRRLLDPDIGLLPDRLIYRLQAGIEPRSVLVQIMASRCAHDTRTMAATGSCTDRNVAQFLNMDASRYPPSSTLLTRPSQGMPDAGSDTGCQELRGVPRIGRGWDDVVDGG